MNQSVGLQINRFKVPTELSVFETSLSGHVEVLRLAREAVEELRVSHPASTPSNVRAVYMSPWKSHLLTPKLQPLLDVTASVIRKISIDFLRMDLDGLNYDLLTADAWCAVYEQADSAVLHSHYPADFSCVAYLDMEPGAAPIIFANALEVRPVPGSLLVFPGLLPHHVPATPGRRVVAAMNFIKVPKPLRT
jgi:hypothetical protein